jgi:hypothetical protein
MYHTIQFTVDFVADLEISRKHRLEQVIIHKGQQVKAEIRPYVLETAEGPVEVADLFFEDGTATRRVPFDYFFFVE